MQGHALDVVQIGSRPKVGAAKFEVVNQVIVPLLQSISVKDFFAFMLNRVWLDGIFIKETSLHAATYSIGVKST
jgi:hypothetical protein